MHLDFQSVRNKSHDGFEPAQHQPSTFFWEVAVLTSSALAYNIFLQIVL